MNACIRGIASCNQAITENHAVVLIVTCSKDDVPFLLLSRTKKVSISSRDGGKGAPNLGISTLKCPTIEIAIID